MVTRVGVVGHPIGHSLSPLLHGRWIKAYGVDAIYEAFDGEADGGFAEFWESRLPHLTGVNVTLPYKTEALSRADTVTDRAREIGAANLLMRQQDGEVLADNTDGIGFAAAVAPLLSRKGKARVLGAGGAAPAILWALLRHGFGTIETSNRTAEKARSLANRFGTDTVDWSGRSEGLADVDILVNTTSLGLPGSPPLGVDIADLKEGALVVDIVTDPGGTPLLQEARRRGLGTQTGLPMLVHQAIPSFAAWFGITPEDPQDAVAFLEGAA